MDQIEVRQKEGLSFKARNSCANTTIKVNEIFKSIQGESTYAGLPCIFIRLTGCNLRCRYCDTRYAYEEGDDWDISELIEKVTGYKCDLVLITGGEPLLQSGTKRLIKQLTSAGSKVLLETNGSIDIRGIDKNTTIVMDMKCPGSGMSRKNLWDNIEHLKGSDEVKFVIGSRSDYVWARTKISEFNLAERCVVLFSPVYGKLPPEKMADWILKDKIPVRLQLQLHKYIWSPDMRGV